MNIELVGPDYGQNISALVESEPLPKGQLIGECYLKPDGSLSENIENIPSIKIAAWLIPGSPANISFYIELPSDFQTYSITMRGVTRAFPQLHSYLISGVFDGDLFSIKNKPGNRVSLRYWTGQDLPKAANMPIVFGSNHDVKIPVHSFIHPWVCAEITVYLRPSRKPTSREMVFGQYCPLMMKLCEREFGHFAPEAQVLFPFNAQTFSSAHEYLKASLPVRDDRYEITPYCADNEKIWQQIINDRTQFRRYTEVGDAEVRG